MSNFYFPKHNCVFIHIPKTGGTSIRKGFFKGNYEGPFFGKIPEKYSQCFKFAFVRNPFDRLISAWKHFTTGTDTISSKEKSSFRNISLESFLNIVTNNSIIYDGRRSTFKEKIRHHTIPQTHPFNCLNEADFVGCFETLEKDFEVICEKLKIKSNRLPKINKSKRSREYKNYFTPSTRKITEKYYKKDLEKLGYKF
ncbi:MAG: sulfotransferase family 2 domain-containing protein [Candidatus Woesearchaeota archaeon]